MMQVASTSFDAVADDYDAQFTDTLIGRVQRGLVWAHLETVLEGGAKDVLELNCGTGEDARWMSEAGHRVFATDISPKMVQVTQSKLPQIDTAVVGLSDLGECSVLEGRKFDVIFSNFGGLNCVNPNALGGMADLSRASRRPSARVNRGCRSAQPIIAEGGVAKPTGRRPLRVKNPVKQRSSWRSLGYQTDNSAPLSGSSTAVTGPPRKRRNACFRSSRTSPKAISHKHMRGIGTKTSRPPGRKRR